MPRIKRHPEGKEGSISSSEDDKNVGLPKLQRRKASYDRRSAGPVIQQAERRRLKSGKPVRNIESARVKSSKFLPNIHGGMQRSQSDVHQQRKENYERVVREQRQRAKAAAPRVPKQTGKSLKALSAEKAEAEALLLELESDAERRQRLQKEIQTDAIPLSKILKKSRQQKALLEPDVPKKRKKPKKPKPLPKPEPREERVKRSGVVQEEEEDVGFFLTANFKEEHPQSKEPSSFHDRAISPVTLGPKDPTVALRAADSVLQSRQPVSPLRSLPIASDARGAESNTSRSKISQHSSRSNASEYAAAAMKAAEEYLSARLDESLSPPTGKASKTYSGRRASTSHQADSEEESGYAEDFEVVRTPQPRSSSKLRTSPLVSTRTSSPEKSSQATPTKRTQESSPAEPAAASESKPPSPIVSPSKVHTRKLSKKNTGSLEQPLHGMQTSQAADEKEEDFTEQSIATDKDEQEEALGALSPTRGETAAADEKASSREHHEHISDHGSEENTDDEYDDDFEDV